MLEVTADRTSGPQDDRIPARVFSTLEEVRRAYAEAAGASAALGRATRPGSLGTERDIAAAFYTLVLAGRRYAYLVGNLRDEDRDRVYAGAGPVAEVLRRWLG